MGLILSVYKDDSSDCSNSGISSKHSRVCVVNASGPFEPSDEYPAVVLTEGPFNSVNLVPVELIGSGKWTMFGGNYAGTSDSRFSEAVEKMCGYRHGMIKIHDRVE